MTNYNKMNKTLKCFHTESTKYEQIQTDDNEYLLCNQLIYQIHNQPFIPF